MLRCMVQVERDFYQRIVFAFAFAFDIRLVIFRNYFNETCSKGKTLEQTS